MRRKTILASVLAIGLLGLVGCGGGGNSGGGSERFRRLLAGDGDTASGGVTSAKHWRTVAMKANANYIGTGADQPCPVELDHKNGIDSTSCDPDDYLELRSDGRSRAFSAGVLESTFDDTWSVAGTTLSTTTISGSDRVVASFSLIDEGVVGGRQRIRLRTIAETEADGTTPRPGEAGFEFLIEEVP